MTSLKPEGLKFEGLKSVELLREKATTRMDALFRTGYPHPVNFFATLMLTVLPLLSPFIGGHPAWNNGVAGLIGLVYLIIWSRLRVLHPGRSAGFYQGYLFVQTAAVSAIYALGGGLTRLLFVVVAVQAVYIAPVKRWAPFLGTLAALWLTLYLALFPDGPASGMIAVIGMYFSYLIFAALVTFTTVQQDRQVKVAHELLDGVDQRHQMLRAYQRRIANRAETDERERLAQTIGTMLRSRLAQLTELMNALLAGSQELNRQSARAVRLEAKETLGAVRQAVRTLRPGESSGGEADREEPDEPFIGPLAPEAEVAHRWTDPIRVYHFWNLGVVVLTTGIIIAANLVGGLSQWLPLLELGVGIIAVYLIGIFSRRSWSRTLFLIFQAGLMVRLVAISREPLMNHLFLIIAAQAVFLVPTVNRWLAVAILFPTLLSAAALWLTGDFHGHWAPLLIYTAAFAVTNFFGGVMAFMTRRQVAAREQALIYAQQLAEVNRLLEARQQEVRRLAISGERVRMAREMHDGLGHHLTIVIVDLQYAEELADEDPAGARAHIAEAARVVEAAVAASKELYATLERFDRPLPVALRDLAAAWQKGNRVLLSLHTDGDFTVLSTAAHMTIYRAVQESLTNIQKHSQATQVEVSLTRLHDRVVLTVANDETRPRPEAEFEKGGFGLMGLRERAISLQGEFEAGVRPEGGFLVRLVLPLGGQSVPIDFRRGEVSAT